MTGLDIFALIVLLVLVFAGVGVLVALGMAPGKIARERSHPQAEAINVCGWWGILTLGILLPIAWIWAYTTPSGILTPASPDADVAPAAGDAP